MWFVALWLCGCEAAAPAGSSSDSATVPAADRGHASEPVGSDWPIFLGPQDTGVSDETGLLEEWPSEGPPVLWEKRIGTGYSAPSVLGERLVLHHRPAGGEEIVECLRAADGEHLWQVAYRSDFRDPYGYNNGPRCTPLLSGGRCYTFGAEGKLLCLDLANGREIWSRDIKQGFNVPDGFFGVGCTPILDGDLLIVLVGGQPNSGVVAFQAATGETVWEAVGQDTWNGVETDSPAMPRYEWTGDEMVVSYSSPLAATIHGKRHILCLTRQGLVSLDPKQGTFNFKYWFQSQAYESVNAARPIVVGDRVFISAAYRTGSALLQVLPDGKSYQVLWRNRRNMLTHWSTAIHVDGCIYGFSGRHESEARLRCLDLATGNVVWETTGFEGDTSHLQRDRKTGLVVNRDTGKVAPFPFYGRGSKILVDNKFIVLGERGTLALVKMDRQGFHEISRASYENIRYPSWTAPVLSRKRLYLRDEDTLLCLDVGDRTPGESAAADDTSDGGHAPGARSISE